jgi:hypothetical protein
MPRLWPAIKRESWAERMSVSNILWSNLTVARLHNTSSTDTICTICPSRDSTPSIPSLASSSSTTHVTNHLLHSFSTRPLHRLTTFFELGCGLLPACLVRNPPTSLPSSSENECVCSCAVNPRADTQQPPCATTPSIQHRTRSHESVPPIRSTRVFNCHLERNIHHGNRSPN